MCNKIISREIPKGLKKNSDFEFHKLVYITYTATKTGKKTFFLQNVKNKQRSSSIHFVFMKNWKGVWVPEYNDRFKLLHHSNVCNLKQTRSTPVKQRWRGSTKKPSHQSSLIATKKQKKTKFHRQRGSVGERDDSSPQNGESSAAEEGKGVIIKRHKKSLKLQNYNDSP